MRKELTLLGIVAGLMACDDEPTEEQKIAQNPEEKRCVDKDGKYVDEKLCDAPPPNVQRHGSTVVYSPGVWYHPVYVPYGYYSGVGSHSGVYWGAVNPGSGRTAAISAAPASRGGFGASSGGSASVSRGGFGGSAAGHASSAG